MTILLITFDMQQIIMPVDRTTAMNGFAITGEMRNTCDQGLMGDAIRSLIDRSDAA